MKNWIKKDLRYIWHPYTQMKDCQELPPVFIKRAKGVKLYDQNDRCYYDTISSWWCNVHGHNHPHIKRAIDSQLNNLDHVLFAGFTHKPAILLAEKLIEITPANLTKIFFADNGSTSVETAIKMSFQYWKNIGRHKKEKFISLDMGYHGDTMGAMSVGGATVYNKTFKPLLFDSIKIPTPYCYRCPVDKESKNCDIECLKPLRKILSEKNQIISAMIIEPLVLGASGIIVYPVRYLKKVRELTRKYDVHLILDEVATGFGRTGKMFACGHANITPEFICLSKGITSGTLPLGATLTTEKIYQAFYSDYKDGKTFLHGHTYSANPISCSAANASLEIFKKDNSLKKINKIIPYFHDKLNDFKDLDLVGDVRYIGMIGAIELVKNKKTKEKFEKRIGLKIYKEGLKKGLVLRPLGNVTYFFLPLCIKRKEIDIIIKKTFDIIKNLNPE